MRKLALILLAVAGCDGAKDTDLPAAQLCSQAGTACDAAASQPAGFLCVSGTCRESCTTNAECTTAGTYCNDTTADRYCAPSECAGFFEGGCAAAQRCVPAGATAFRCVANGTGAANSSCTRHEECGAGLLCPPEVGACYQPQCSTDSAAQPCPVSTQVCQEVPNTGTGICLDSCEAFSNTGCDAGDWCLPGEQRDSNDHVVGACVPDVGSVAEGGACGGSTGGNCAAGLLCLRYGSAPGQCYRLCDPEAATSGLGNTCDAGDPCNQAAMADPSGNPVTMPWGTCGQGCEAFTNVGCTNPQWCVPSDARDGNGHIIGSCGPAGTAGAGATCGGAVGCAAGLICLSFDGTNFACETLCDPSSATSGVGACTSGTCSPLNLGQGPVEFGYCAN